jgi:hypothetical protein
MIGAGQFGAEAEQGWRVATQTLLPLSNTPARLPGNV